MSKRITVQGANGWYVATEDEAGFHHQPSFGIGCYKTEEAAEAAADAEDAEDEEYERDLRHARKEAAIFAKKNPVTAAYIAARGARSAAGRAARDAWLACDEPRYWQLAEIGDQYWLWCYVRPSEIEKKLEGECRRFCANKWGRTKTISVDNWARPIDPVTHGPVGKRVNVTTNIVADVTDAWSARDWRISALNKAVHDHNTTQSETP
jgi:hypothetical protein